MNTTFRIASIGLLVAFCSAAGAQEGVQWTPEQSAKARAEVRAELEAAQRSGAFQRTEASYTVRASSSLTRAQVQAEAREAKRLGLIPMHEGDHRQATAAELEQIRQAGLRAAANSARLAGK